MTDLKIGVISTGATRSVPKELLRRRDLWPILKDLSTMAEMAIYLNLPSKSIVFG
jgi:hypothetical protein